MKTKRKTFLVTCIAIMAVIWAFAIIEKRTGLMEGLDLIIFILIVIGSIIAFVSAVKKDKEEKAGLPTEDELSDLLKYKTGYYAFFASMILWCIIFLFKDRFPNNESMVGGGILLSAVLFFIAKLVVKKQLYEK